MGSPRTPRIDRARADDVLQVAVDRAGRVPMVIGALLVLDPDSRPSAHEVRTVLLRRAASVPRLGQRLATTPPGAGRAVWLDAGSLALAGRVDSTLVAGLAAASGPDPDPDERARVTRRALLDATAELVLERLPAHELLWRARLLLAPGGGVAAIALVAHHALADGMGGLAVLGALADPPAGVVRDHTASGAPGGRSPEALPPWAALVREAWSGRLGRRAGEDRGRRRRAAGHRGGTGRAGRARGGVRRLAGGLGELGLGRPRLAARCSLLGRTGDRRHLELLFAKYQQ